MHNRPFTDTVRVWHSRQAMMEGTESRFGTYTSENTMNGFVLRLIAMLTMLLDHIAWSFLPDPMVLTWIGRIAFPLYAFLLADGFLFVKGDAKRLTHHVAILLVLAIVSEPCFDFMDYGFDFSRYMDFQSNIITLLLGYLALIATNALAPDGRLSLKAGRRLNTAAIVSAYVLASITNFLVKGNFNLVGPLLVIALYWYDRAARGIGHGNKPWPIPRRLIALVAIFLAYLIVYFWARADFGGVDAWWGQVSSRAPWIVGHFLALLIICLYDGTLGYHEKWFARLYTAFYPLHLFVIGMINMLLSAL